MTGSIYHSDSETSMINSKPLPGHRHWGMRVIIPPAAVHQPTRIQCRYTQLSSVPYPPPFMEREALASRIIDMSPAGESFKSPVLIEIPHFASSAGAERETIVLRCDDGETWYEHVSDKVENGEIYQVRNIQTPHTTLLCIIRMW